MTLFAAEEANVWSAVPTMLWVGLLGAVLLMLRRPIRDLAAILVTRIHGGASMKVGAVEIGPAVHTFQHVVPASAIPRDSSFEGIKYGKGVTREAVELNIRREGEMARVRRVMLVHRIFRSEKPGQLYDVLIYLLPHKNGSLIEVKKVDYFLGKYWGNEVFSSNDRSRGFPLLTSAYGTFLCCARIWFNDNEHVEAYRYIDFEMGAVAPILESGAKKAAETGDKEK